MRSILLYTTVCLCSLCATLPADDAASPEVFVYPVRSTPPDQIVETLQSLYGDDAALRVTTSPGGRTLLLRVDPQIRDDVLTVLENIDPPTNRLAIQVTLIHQLPDADPADLDALAGPAEDVWNAVRDLEGRGQIRVSDRIQTTALENQQSMVSIGQRRPVVTGVSNAAPGFRAATYRQQDTGTIVTFRGRSTPDGEITLEIQFEKSELVELPETEIQQGVAASGTDITTLRSTVSLHSGVATLLSAAGSGDADQQDRYLILSATLLKPGDDRVASMFYRPRPAARPTERDGQRGGFRGSPFGSDNERTASLADALFQRFDTNQDGVLRPDDLPANLRLTSPQDAEWDRDTFRQWMREVQLSPDRDSFRAGGSRSSDASAPDIFGPGARGGFGGFSRGDYRPLRSGLLTTLRRDDVAQSVALNAEQQARVEELARSRPVNSELSERMREIFSRTRDASAEERAQINREMVHLRRQQEGETDQRLAEILSTEQMARLKQLELQYSGYSALLRDDVAAGLNLTDEQKSRFQQVAVDLSQRFRERGVSADERDELERQYNEQYFTVLTDEQRLAWLEMVGEVIVDNGTPRN